MDQSPRQYVFEGMETLPDALVPFVEKQLRATLTGHWQVEVARKINGLKLDSSGNPAWDQAALLKTIDQFWWKVFAARLGHAERSIVHELIDVRNRLSHYKPFSWDDTERALDSMRRLMTAIGADDCAQRIGDMRDAVLRSKYADPTPHQERHSVRRSEAPLRDADEVSRKFTKDEFDRELYQILEEERAAGKDTCKVISRDLHRRVVGGNQPNRMAMACNAMWKLWQRQGSHPGRIIHTTPSRRSTTIEIEYHL